MGEGIKQKTVTIGQLFDAYVRACNDVRKAFVEETEREREKNPFRTRATTAQRLHYCEVKVELSAGEEAAVAPYLEEQDQTVTPVAGPSS